MVFLRVVTHLHEARNEKRKAVFDQLPKRRLKPYNSSRQPSKPVLQHRELGHFLEFRWSQAVDATPGAKGEREA